MSTLTSTLIGGIQGCAWLISAGLLAHDHYRQSRPVRLDAAADKLLKTEREAIAAAERTDGRTTKKHEADFRRRLRFSRSAIVSLSVLVVALCMARIAFDVAWSAEGVWRVLTRHAETWPIATRALIWTNALYLAYACIQGHLQQQQPQQQQQQQQHWHYVLHLASLISLAFTCDVVLAVLPKEGETLALLASQILDVVLSFVAVLITINIPSGPRRVVSRSGAQAADETDDRLVAALGPNGATLLSSIWFTGAVPIVMRAYRKGYLDGTDAPPLGSVMGAQVLYLRFRIAYEKSMSKVKPAATPEPPRARPTKDGSKKKKEDSTWQTIKGSWPLARAVLSANKGLIIYLEILSAISGVSFYAPSLVTFLVVSFLEEQEQQVAEGKAPMSGLMRLRHGLPYCVLLASAMLFTSLVMGQVMSVGLAWLRTRIRLQLQSVIFAKALRRKDAGSANAPGEEGEAEEDKKSPLTKGADEDKKEEDEDDEDDTSFVSKTQVVNLASVDTERASQLFYLVTFAMAPIELITGGTFVIKLLGWGALLGFAVSLLIQPLIFLVGKAMVRFEAQQQAVRDRKVTLLNEIFAAIRMVKFNAWEHKMSDRLLDVREKELKCEAKIFVADVITDFFFASSPTVVILVSYAWYTIVQGKTLTPSVAFTSLAVLEEMRFSLTQIPEALAECAQSLVSVQRIQQYLQSDEVDVIPPSASAPASSSAATAVHEQLSPKLPSNGLGKQPDDDQDEVALHHATVAWPVLSQPGENAAGAGSVPVDDLEAGPAATSMPPSRAEPAFQLLDFDVTFERGQLNVIVGKLGSGKTLLLRALLGEADIVSGQAICPRSRPDAIDDSLLSRNEGQGGLFTDQGWIRRDQTAFVPQTAFLTNASLRDNVLFGLPLWEQRYRQTITACGLDPDVALLEDGDETEIGESGIGLSGGQKTRVSLARAVYSRGATLILDDVLSAVDAHTASHIYNELFRGPLCENRTVILVSHQVQLVAPGAARIVMVDEGTKRFDGDPMAFMKSDLYHGLLEEQEEEADEKTHGAKRDSSEVPSEPPSGSATPSTASPKLNGKNELKPETLEAAVADANGDTATLPKKTPRKLVEEEKRAKGGVLLSIYKTYLEAAGGMPYFVVLVVSFCVAESFMVVVSRWLQYWSSDATRAEGPLHSNEWWISRWAILWVIQLTLLSFKTGFLYYGSLSASRKLFSVMLTSVLRAPLRFHDTVSRGRLLNRFGQDFEEVDSNIAPALERFGDQFLTVVVNVVAVTSGGGAKFLIVFAALMPLYVAVGQAYMLAVRDLKRLLSTTKSPILGLFSDVVTGVSVIRSFGASHFFFKTLLDRLDGNATFSFWTNELRWWYEQMFNTISFGLILSAAIFILLNPNVGAAQAGFVFSFLINTHIFLLFLLQSYTDTEQRLISVERVVEYSQLEGEAKEFIEPRPSADWPSQGKIVVQDLRVRYAPELPDVIKGVSFSIPPGSKVGIVGPTGCGKSTMASSFFRFVEASGGSISVDGVDIASVGLHDLRSRLQIVPQDPIILSGPLRATIDVFGEYSDEAISEALRAVRLLDDGGSHAPSRAPTPGLTVPGLADASHKPTLSVSGTATPRSTGQGGNRNEFRDLSYTITEGGSNLSNGEKQLLCLARAILRRSKLIIFDEATSSVDYATDELITATIRRSFEQSTILTIAHRLRTIIDFDLVIVMDKGQVVEFDAPAKLLDDETSRFFKLCRASGRRELAHLKKLAKR